MLGQKFELIVSFPDLQWKQLARCHFGGRQARVRRVGMLGCGGRCCDRPADWPLTASWATRQGSGSPLTNGEDSLGLLGILGVWDRVWRIRFGGLARWCFQTQADVLYREKLLVLGRNERGCIRRPTGSWIRDGTPSAATHCCCGPLTYPRVTRQRGGPEASKATTNTAHSSHVTRSRQSSLVVQNSIWY